MLCNLKTLVQKWVVVQAVYGCYSAVALADVTALQLLPEKLPSLFKHCTWQAGAYQVLPERHQKLHAK